MTTGLGSFEIPPLPAHTIRRTPRITRLRYPSLPDASTLNTSCSVFFNTCTACRVLEYVLAIRLCQFKYTRHSCGHTLPKLEDPYDPSCKLCVPVMVALKYYYDQVTQVCIENALQQPPLQMPRPCRPVAPNSMGEAEEIAHITLRARRHLRRLWVGLG